MKPYEHMEFCKNNELCVYADSSLGLKNREHCKSCIAHRFHAYLSANNQILEPGSDLARLVEALMERKRNHEEWKEAINMCSDTNKYPQISRTLDRQIDEILSRLEG